MDGTVESRTLRLDPELTVVITTKDRPVLLRRALDSAAAVADAGLATEIIVVDDSSDTPVDIADSPCSRVLRHATSKGANVARNTGLWAARGRWVLFLDDDDEIVADGVVAAVRALRDHGDDDIAVLGTLTSVDEATGRREDHVPRAIPRGADWLAVPRFDGRHAHNGLIAPVAVLREIGGFDARIKSWTHDEMFLRLLLAVSLRTTDRTVYVMYENPQRSTLRQHHVSRAQGILATLRRHDELHGREPGVTSRLMSAAGLHFARARRWGESREAFARALAASPTNRLVWVRLGRALGGSRRA